jgi:hypothetical protein
MMAIFLMDFIKAGWGIAYAKKAQRYRFVR